MEQSNGLKIIGLKINGIRKLSAIEMEFNDSGLIPIVGGNEAGKTSILDSLEILLTGNKAAPYDIIQHGKDRAEIIGKVADSMEYYEIKRTTTRKSDQLEIRNKEGFIMDKKVLGKTLQKFLDTFINELTFNPRPFLNKSPEQKLKFMMDLFELDFTEQDNKIKEFEQERLLVGREIKNMGEIAEVEEIKRVDINELLNQKTSIEFKNNELREKHEKKKEETLKEIVRFNDEQKEKIQYIKIKENEINILKQQEIELNNELENLTSRIRQNKNDINQKNGNLLVICQPEELKSLEVPIDLPEYKNTENIENQIKAASEINRKADEYEKYIEKIANKERKKINYSDFSDQINMVRDQKKKILSETDIPVADLEIREDGIYHDNIYSENWSESEGLRISSQLCIAMNPKLRAICIDHGESYDSDSLKNLEQWAKDHDIQAFISIVDEIPEKMEPGVFYIEDGSLITKE